MTPPIASLGLDSMLQDLFRKPLVDFSSIFVPPGACFKVLSEGYVMPKKKEQRKHKRYQAPKGVFVGIGPSFTKVGGIIDVSMGGLAFRYVGSQEPSDESYLDIFSTDYDFYLGKIPFKAIWDFEKVTPGPSSSTTMRQSGLQFGKLTHYQKSLLAHFIHNHVTGEA